MNRLSRIVMSAGAVAAVATPVALAGPAQAGLDANITIHATDTSVRSGEQFRVYGAYRLGDGTPVRNKLVQVQSKNPDGSWSKVSGARLRTNDEGRYRIRVVLSRKGDRVLRVRAQGPTADSSAIRSKPITIRVR